MSVTAIIAEYNPMHKGHEYLIDRARQITGADYVLVVMSGDFVQRGAPAVMNKYMRTETALLGGADLVIELPAYYSLASAEYFAKGAVSLIDSLNVADSICFGVECDDMKLLYELAEIPVFYKEEYDSYVSKFTSEGASFAKADAMAICEIIGNMDDESDNYALSYSIDELEQILSSPNNTLAISYIKALVSLDSPIKAYGVKRLNSEYHDESLGALSSSAVRKELIDGNFAPLKDQLSDEIYDYLSTYLDTTYPINIDDYSDILVYKLMDIIYGSGNNIKASGILKLTEFLDVSESLAARIINCLNDFESFSQFTALLKTKDTTYSRISRALMHIVLNIKKSNFNKYIANNYSLYARILGFNESSSGILSLLKQNSTIPVISKLADAEKNIGDELTMKLLNENTYTAEIYGHIASNKFKTDFIPEYSRPIVLQRI